MIEKREIFIKDFPILDVYIDRENNVIQIDITEDAYWNLSKEKFALIDIENFATKFYSIVWGDDYGVN